MSDFKERLQIERTELTDKIVKLSKFLENDKVMEIDSDQLMLLNIQLNAMKTYNTCLNARINKLDEV